MFINESDISKVTTDKPKKKFKDVKLEYQRIIREAEDIINGLPVFSFGLFEDKFFNKVGSWDNVFSALIEHIQTLELEGRYGYAASNKSTLSAIKEFNDGRRINLGCREKIETRYKDYIAGKNLSFQDITPTWLKRFDASLKKKEKSKSTRGIYARNIRTLFNLAIKKHDVKAEYPFYEYTPKQASGRKLALSPYQMSLIANYKTDVSSENI